MRTFEKIAAKIRENREQFIADLQDEFARISATPRSRTHKHGIPHAFVLAKCDLSWRSLQQVQYMSLDVRLAFTKFQIPFECRKGIGWVPFNSNPQTELPFAEEKKILITDETTQTIDENSFIAVESQEIQPQNEAQQQETLYGKTVQEFLIFLKEKYAEKRSISGRGVSITDIQLWTGKRSNTNQTDIVLCKAFFRKNSIPWITKRGTGFVPLNTSDFEEESENTTAIVSAMEQELGLSDSPQVEEQNYFPTLESETLSRRDLFRMKLSGILRTVENSNRVALNAIQAIAGLEA